MAGPGRDTPQYDVDEIIGHRGTITLRVARLFFRCFALGLPLGFSPGTSRTKAFLA